MTRLVLEITAEQEGLTLEAFLTREMAKPMTLEAHAKRLGVSPSALFNARKKVGLVKPHHNDPEVFSIRSKITAIARERNQTVKEMLAELLTEDGCLKAVAAELRLSEATLMRARRRLGFPTIYGNSGDRRIREQPLSQDQLTEVLAKRKSWT